MAAIDDAEKEVEKLTEKHGDKIMDLWGRKKKDFWTKKTTEVAKKAEVPSNAVLPWVAFVEHDGRPVRAERFRTQEDARKFRKEFLGIKTNINDGSLVEKKAIKTNATGNKVEATCKIRRANELGAKELFSRLPKVRTKAREPKRHQHDLFR